MLPEGRAMRADCRVNKAFFGLMDAWRASENCFPPLATVKRWTSENHYLGTQSNDLAGTFN